jgi:hypothetical protein
MYAKYVIKLEIYEKMINAFKFYIKVHINLNSPSHKGFIAFEAHHAPVMNNCYEGENMYLLIIK